MLNNTDRVLKSSCLPPELAAGVPFESGFFENAVFVAGVPSGGYIQHTVLGFLLLKSDSVYMRESIHYSVLPWLYLGDPGFLKIKAAFDELISPALTKSSKIKVEINNELDGLKDKELKTIFSFIKKLKHSNSTEDQHK